MTDPVEYLRQAKQSLDQYREASRCGYCKDQVGIVVDGLEALIETDANLRVILEQKLDHPGVAALPRVRDEFTQARDASRRLASRLEDNLEGQRGNSRALNLGLREIPRTLRESVRDIVPRPGILPSRRPRHVRR